MNASVEKLSIDSEMKEKREEKNEQTHIYLQCWQGGKTTDLQTETPKYNAEREENTTPYELAKNGLALWSFGFDWIVFVFHLQITKPELNICNMRT